MRQHSIDLLPTSIRMRTQAGERTTRFLLSASIALVLLIVMATHSRVTLVNADQRLQDVHTQAHAILAIDQEATERKKVLQSHLTYIKLYEKVAYPIDVSAVIATLVEALPESVTLEQFDVDAGAKSTGRSPRSRGLDDKNPSIQQVLRCEISGFAASDDHIAQLVARLENLQPFQTVNLDFSRTKRIRDRDAREFRLSFRIDFNAAYDVHISDGSSQGMERGDEP